MQKRIMLALSAILLLSMAAYTQAIGTTSSVRFNIATYAAYTVTLPGQSAVNATSSLPSTAAIDINSSDGQSKSVEPCVTGGTCQSSTQPFFQFDNIGTVNINLSINMNQTLPTCITLEGANLRSNLNGAGSRMDTICASGNASNPLGGNCTTNVTVTTNFAPPDAVVNWSMMANFTNCVQANSTNRQLFTYGFTS